MNKFIAYAILAAAAAPALSFAQSNSPVTRAQVRAELVQVEMAGYSPSAHSNSYPADIQSAETKIKMLQLASNVSPFPRSAGGLSMSGSSQSGMPKAQACIGPISFCDTYFGR